MVYLLSLFLPCLFLLSQTVESNQSFFVQAERMGMTTVLNVSGIDKEEFVRYTEEKPATYQDWSRTWTQVVILLC